MTPGTPYDAKGLLKSAIRDDNPVLFLEGEMLYNTKGEVPDEEYVIPIGKADLKREGDHCSIITTARWSLVAMQAADQLAKEGISVDVVDLRTVRPMDVEAITTSVEKTIAPSCSRKAGSSPASARRWWTTSSASASTPRCAGDPRAPGRRPDAVREESRASRQARRREDDRGGRKVMYLD